MKLAAIMFAVAMVANTPALAQTTGVPATGLDETRLAKARDVVALIIPPDQRDQMFEAVLNSFMGSMLAGMMQGDPEMRDALDNNPRIKPVFAKFVERQRDLAMDDLRESTPRLIEAYTIAYARNFTDGELLEMKRFFETATGQRYVEKTADLLSDPELAAWQRDITAVAQSRQQEELQRFLEEIMPLVAAGNEDDES